MFQKREKLHIRWSTLSFRRCFFLFDKLCNNSVPWNSAMRSEGCLSQLFKLGQSMLFSVSLKYIQKKLRKVQKASPIYLTIHREVHVSIGLDLPLISPGSPFLPSIPDRAGDNLPAQETRIPPCWENTVSNSSGEPRLRSWLKQPVFGPPHLTRRRGQKSGSLQQVISQCRK